MNKTNGFIKIQALVDCPHCTEIIDILEYDEWHEEYGYGLIDYIIRNGNVGTDDLGFSFICAKCGEKFVVGRLDYAC